MRNFTVIEGYLVGRPSGEKQLPDPPKSGRFAFSEGTPEWYLAAYKEMEFDKGYENAIHGDTQTVLRGKARYMALEQSVGVPWWIIGGIHFKESSCDFKGCLHNGERIIGTKRKTSLVPAGHGPFDTWEEAAIDAIQGKRWDKIRSGSRDIGEIFYAVERYNGTGYLTGAGREETSPYLWARTSINDDFGKYVKDGVFDKNAPTNKTTGFAAIVKELERFGEIKIGA